MPAVTYPEKSNKLTQQEYDLRIKLIAEHPLFGQLPHAALLELAELMDEIKVSANEKIILEDDFVDCVYFIVQGKAKVTKKQMFGEVEINVMAGILGTGETIGLNEKGFFSPHGKRTATVSALTDMVLLRLDLKDFHKFMETHPIFDEILKSFSDFLLKLNFLKQAYPFSYLNNEVIYNLSKEIKELNLPTNTIIFNKGDEAQNCYLIQKGQVEVFLPENGTEKRLFILDPPQIVGEAALLTSNKRNASVRTLVPTKLLVIEQSLLVELMKANVTFAESVVGFMLNRIRPIQGENIQEHTRTTKDGQLLVVLHHTILNEYFKLDEPKYFIWKQLDGIQSVRDLTIIFFKKFKLFAPDMICTLIYNLAELGFVKVPSISIEYEKLEEPKTILGKLSISIQKFTQKELFLTKVDNWITPLYQRWLWVCFSLPGILLFSVISSLGLILLFKSYPQILALAQTTQPSFLLLVLLLIPVSTLTVFAHEGGHALVAKKFGYKVQRMGIGWFFFAPIAFTDTSELWIANKKARVAVDVAGIGVDLTVGGIFSILAFQFNNGVSIYLWLFSLFAYFNAFKNFSPLKDYDGYYLITDLLDIYQLRKRSIKWIIQFTQLINSKQKVQLDSNAIYYWSACLIYLGCYAVFFYLFLVSLLNIFSIPTVFGIPNSILVIGIIILILSLSIIGTIKEVLTFAKFERP